jgi:hypothetical protein
MDHSGVRKKDERFKPIHSKSKWRCKSRTYLNLTSKDTIEVLIFILTHKKEFAWEVPIGQLIKRTHDYEGWGDACLDSGGGMNFDLEFWYELEWPEDIKNRTLRNLKPGSETFLTAGLIDINCLEYAILIIGFAGATLAWLNSDRITRPPQPILLQHVNNTSTESWTKKAAKHSVAAKALSLILANIMMYFKMGINAQYLEGKLNICADKISRVHSKNSRLQFDQIQQEFPRLRSCRRYLPSPELLSALYAALSSGKAPPVGESITLGRFSHEKGISKNGVENTI